jgi:hypothetical protein
MKTMPKEKPSVDTNISSDLVFEQINRNLEKVKKNLQHLKENRTLELTQERFDELFFEGWNRGYGTK